MSLALLPPAALATTAEEYDPVITAAPKPPQLDEMKRDVGDAATRVSICSQRPKQESVLLTLRAIIGLIRTCEDGQYYATASGQAFTGVGGCCDPVSSTCDYGIGCGSSRTVLYRGGGTGRWYELVYVHTCGRKGLTRG